MRYEELFVNPLGRTARGPYVAALAVLLAAFAFYWFLVPGRTGRFAMLVMLYPGLVLHARRLHDLGWARWPVLLPGALLAAAGGLHLYAPEAAATRPVTLAAVVAAALLIVWSMAGKARAVPAPA